MRIRRAASARRRVDDLIAGGEYGRAERLLRRYVVRYPTEERFELSLGVCLLVKDPSAAKGHIARAVSLAPDDVSTLLLATQWVMSLDAEAGRRYASRAVELGPTDADDLARLAYLRGRYAEADGDDESAELYLREAVEMDSLDPVYAEHLVGLLARLGRVAEARAISDEARTVVFKSDRLDKQRAQLGLD